MSLFGRKKGSEKDMAGGGSATRPAPGLADLQLSENSPGKAARATANAEPRDMVRQTAPTRMQGEVMARSDNQTSGFRPELPKRPVSEIPGMRPSSHDSGVHGGVHGGGHGGMHGGSRTGTDPKTLIVGKEISLNGEISSCDRLIVEGKVEASLAGCQFIEIADGGVFKGAAEIQDAEIRGLFEGKLTVQGRLLICATGRVVGEVRYGQIEIECGGEVSGTIDKVPVAPPARVERPAPVKPPVSMAETPEPDTRQEPQPVGIAAGAE